MDTFYQAKSSLVFYIMGASRLLSVFLNKQLRESGLPISPEQWIVLAVLWDNAGMSQDELGKYLNIEKSSLSRQVEIMERDGLIRRSRDARDRRRKLLTTTAKADQIKDQCKAVSEKALPRMLAGIEPEEVKRCIDVLAQVQRNTSRD